MKEHKKFWLLDWRFKIGIFCLILMLLFVITSLILLPTANFINNFNQPLGNGFWAISHYGIHDLLFNWTKLDDHAIVNSYVSHPFQQVYVSIIFFLFLTPILLVIGSFLVVRWFIKTRI